MDTNTAFKEYQTYLQTIADNHLSDMKERETLNVNDKQDVINKFFTDIDDKAAVKGSEILKMFPSQGDKAVLNNQFVITQRKINDSFKNEVMAYTKGEDDNPIV